MMVPSFGAVFDNKITITFVKICSRLLDRKFLDDGKKCEARQ